MYDLIFNFHVVFLIFNVICGYFFSVGSTYVGSSSISMKISLGSESTQATMERLVQQMNSQGLFNIMESIDDNLYDFTNTGCDRGTAESERVLNNVV